MLLWRVFVLFALMTTLGVSASVAQQPGDDACPALVDQALQSIGNACAGIGRDEACYGHLFVDASFWPTAASPAFQEPTDRVALVDIQSVTTSPLDLGNETWGLALLNLQANLPNVAPGQVVTFLLMGDVTVENNITPDQASSPIVAVPATNNIAADLYRCPLLDGAVMESLPAGSALSVVGRGEAGDWYEVLLPSGRYAWIEAGAVQPGAGVSLGDLPVTYGQGIPPRCGAMQAFYFTMGVGVPECREAPNSLVVQTPQDLEVAFNINGLDITVGSSVALNIFDMPPPPDDPQATGGPVLLVTLLEGEMTAQFEQPQSARAPVGVPKPLACNCVTMVEVDTPGATLAVALNEDGTVDLESRLVNFSGDPGLVTDMVRQACRNAAFSNTLSRPLACDFGVFFPEPCTATPAGGYAVNQRGGPGTGYDALDSRQAGTLAVVNGQTTGRDGFTWWRLAQGDYPCAWVRSDVVDMAGACDYVPLIPLDELPEPPPPLPTQPPAQPTLPPDQPPDQPTEEVPTTPEPPPDGDTRFVSVWNCVHLGENIFEWYSAEVTYDANDQPIDAQIVEGPFTGDWQPNCPTGIICGDGICTEGWEDYMSCPGDCPVTPTPYVPVCGDGICEMGEPGSCYSDCYNSCGNGVCESGPPHYETSSWCPLDCS